MSEGHHADERKDVDVRAEQAVLGSCLRDNRVIGDVSRLVRADQFYYDAHQKIYRKLGAMYGLGKPADLVTMADELKLDGDLDNIGGYGYLANLWEGSPTGANSEYYARIVSDRWLVRELCRVGRTIAKSAEEISGSGADLLDEAQRLVYGVSDKGEQEKTYTLHELLQESFAKIDKRASGKERYGVRTGLVELDDMVCGMGGGELTILAARPSVGKTALAVTVANNAAESGERVLLFSLEQKGSEIADRLLCMRAAVSSYKMRSGKLDSADIDRLQAAGAELSKLKLFVDHQPGQTITRIVSGARRMKAKHGIGLVILDYLQLIEPENRKVNRQEQVAYVSRQLKFLARDLDVPVLALAQLNRDLEDRAVKRPRLSDLRESGSLEQDADTVLLLWKPATDEPAEGPTAVVQCLVEKQRNGPTGEINLRFNKAFMRFENYVPNCGK